MQPSMRGWKLQHVLHWFGEVPDASSCKRTTLYADSSFPKQRSSIALSGQFIDGCGKTQPFYLPFYCQDQRTLELDRNLGSWCCLGHSACFWPFHAQRSLKQLSSRRPNELRAGGQEEVKHAMHRVREVIQIAGHRAFASAVQLCSVERLWKLGTNYGNIMKNHSFSLTSFQCWMGHTTQTSSKFYLTDCYIIWSNLRLSKLGDRAPDKGIYKGHILAISVLWSIPSLSEKMLAVIHRAKTWPYLMLLASDKPFLPVSHRRMSSSCSQSAWGLAGSRITNTAQNDPKSMNLIKAYKIIQRAE